MSRDFHLPGRSPVIACDAMAATSHPLATLAAIETLRAGGNAVDAAVTAVAVLCVVEPQMTGIGGDCFAMLVVPGKPVWGYNGSGRAGARASTEALLAQGHPRDRGQLDPRRDRAGRDRCLGGDPQGAWPLRARSRARARDPLRRAKDFRSRRASPGTGRRRSASCAPIPARRATTCSTAARPPKATSSGLPALAQTLKTIAAKGPRASTKGRLPRRWSRRSPRAARS